MPKISRNRLLAYLALLANTAIWGLAVPIVKKGFDHGLTPNTFLTSRMIIALFSSLPLLYLFRNNKTFTKTLSLSNLTKIIPLEILGTVITLFLLYQGVLHTTSIQASLISITAPIFIVLGGIIFLKEKQEGHEWFGLFFTLIGTIILVINPLISGSFNGFLTGNLLILSQNLTLAVYYLLSKKTYHHLNKLAIVHVSFWVGTIGFTTISLFQGLSPLNSFISLLDPNNLWPLIAVLYMAIPGSLLALTLYLYGQDLIEASEASLFAYLQPIFAIPASVILLHESFTFIEVTATIILFLGVYIAEKR